MSKHISLWGKVNNWAFGLVLAGFIGFGLYAIANLVTRFGVAEAMNQIGFLAITMLCLAVAFEGVRAIRHRGVPPRWWVSLAVALSVPLFFLGAVAAATPPVGQYTFYVVVLAIASIVFQKFVEGRMASAEPTKKPSKTRRNQRVDTQRRNP